MKIIFIRIQLVNDLGPLHLFKLLADELCDLSQDEKKITVVKDEKIPKNFTQNDNF